MLSNREEAKCLNILQDTADLKTLSHKIIKKCPGNHSDTRKYGIERHFAMSGFAWIVILLLMEPLPVLKFLAQSSEHYGKMQITFVSSMTIH
jgi:hypothetical protein